MAPPLRSPRPGPPGSADLGRPAVAVAWFVALPPTFIGPALVPTDAPVALDLAVWGVAGLLMAAILAAVTGAAMARLVREVG